MAGTAGSITYRENGFAVLPANVNLLPVESGVWTPTGLVVNLPSAGIYNLDAVVRSVLQAASNCNNWIGAVLFDVTAGALVPNSEIIVQQIGTNHNLLDSPVTMGNNQSAPISVLYGITVPSQIRIDAKRMQGAGNAPTQAQIISGQQGRTTLRYTRVG